MTRALQLHLPLVTIIKILATLALVYVVRELAPLIMMVLLAAMLAVTVYPLFPWLKRRGLPSWLGITIVVAGLAGSMFLLGVLVLPSLMEQTTALFQNLPKLRQAVLDQLPDNELLQKSVAKALQDFKLPDPKSLIEPLVTAGQVAFGGAMQMIFVLIFMIYLLTDGPRTVRWLFAFFGPHHTAKLEETATEVSKIVSAYVVAQGVTSLICGVYTFAALAALKVPGAVMLATLAALFDVLPVLGFFLAAVPAVLLGLTVSPLTALSVTGVYVFYHAVENYLLVPKIYGTHLRVSDLVVLVSLIAASTLGGILGAIAVLPLVASYPIIERIWLRDLLGSDVVKDHSL